ncbi:hypothetical protein GQ53DRAFT_801361 [Thozetella sp. PMI_491]|nr:hypothetical protein GQ53DRAFT_801361 [Thozetella sp. PMI_491]
MDRQGKRAAGGKGAFSSPGRSFGVFSTSTTKLTYLTEPPNLANISDPNVVVSFKNLLKKDSTTKTKALEDLLSYVQGLDSEKGGAEEAVLEAWVQLYPRLSVDNSRRARELSHALQLELMKSAKKRMERRIPSIVGPWLAGTFDKDRVVARAASDGLTSFLNTDEKMAALWRKCQQQILEYATEAVIETPDTLSDERSTTKEDSEAKYYRVIGGSLSLVLNLLKRGDLDKIEEDLDKFFREDAVWSMAAAEDSFVRKTVYQLLQTCIEARPESVRSQLPRIARILLSDGLKSNQTGSAIDFVQLLTNLTRHFPEVWGTKKSPLDRLHSFVEKGSQGSSWRYWQALDQLLEALPQRDTTSDSAANFLKAMRIGFSRREEPRANAMYATACYINAFGRLVSELTPSVKFVEENFYPLTRQYLHPSPEYSSWTAGGQPKLFRKGWGLVAGHSDPELRESASEEWTRLANAFISRITNSLPAVSKEFEKSQQAILAEGDRWFAVVEALLAPPSHDAETNGSAKIDLADIVIPPSRQVLLKALELLSRRNYKPFGAASVLQSALTKSPRLFEGGGAEVVSSFFPLNDPSKLAELLASPSSPYLLQSVNAIGVIPHLSVSYERIWASFVNTALQQEDISSPVLVSLISSSSATPLAHHHEALQAFLLKACYACATAASDSWGLFEAVLTFNSLTESQGQKLAADIVDHLGSQAQTTGLRALELILRKKAGLLSHNEDLHVAAVAKLLALTEISDTAISSKAASLRALLDQHANGEQRPLLGIIQENLETAGPFSLGIETLVEQAKAAATSPDSPHEDLFPSSNVWMSDLRPFLRVSDPSLALTNSVGGAYFLVKDTATPGKTSNRDRAGRSIPARMAMYTSKLLSSGFNLTSLPPQFQVELLCLLYITVEVAADELTIPGSGGLWDVWNENIETEVEDFLATGRAAINETVKDAKGWKDGSLAQDSLAESLIRVLLQQAGDSSALAFYSAKALSDLLQALNEAHGIPNNLESRFSQLGITKATPENVFAGIAFITGYGEALASSASVTKLCNKLVSDIAGAFPSLESTLRVMVLLNACISVYESGAVPVENRRQVFAVKQMTSWTDTPDEMSPGLAAETCKGLQRISPNVKQVYGPYWEQAIEYALSLWGKARQDRHQSRLAYLHSSIKLVTTLETMEEPNDDLEEALASHSTAISEGLLGLLKLPRENSLPSRIVDALLCRRVEKIPLGDLKDPSELYPLVASDSRDIQTAAFGLLHKAIPAAQSQLSIDALLDKQQVRLPEELLSLLLDAPTLEAYPDELLANFPTPVRCYLLTWHLVFDALGSSVPKVRSDYVDQLKSENYVGPLLEFMFDVLGHSAAHPLSLDKEGFTIDNILQYDIKLADAEPEERNMHWLLTHLYYLVLKYLPGPFKSWFLELRSKQTKIAVEVWMQKYFSPLIISEALDEVSDWTTKQEPPAEDEKELIIKVSKAAKEVTAGYEVDEDTALIAIRIPPAYPLETVTVVGVNRVAVNEKKWQSWLMTTQGVITFTNGSIVDGLAAFRRNVVGALKGQTECAICYSIVSSDKRMPDKKCGTCKNLFHRTCLYRWFQTSNQNTCPLCRNPIDYLGSDTKARRG